METAILGGGCFWCTEAIYQRLKGVISVIPGYAGGDVENPTYEEVSSGKTGHTEVIKIEFDPTIISYEQILKVFFATHDPTQFNRQGNDIGPQYRSVIFYQNDAQKVIAEHLTKWLSEPGRYDGRIVTKIEPNKNFYIAEDYHQNYFNGHKNAPYCQVIIQPKIEHFQEEFKNLLK